jgi:hypothetical protein
MTPTTIHGVSILSGQETDGHDVFEIALSRVGIEVRRPERPAQLMRWERVSEWELDECEGYLLLTLRGQGATTPLVIPDWTFDDLEVLMRDVTSDYAVPEPSGTASALEDEGVDRSGAVVASAPPSTPSPAQAPAPTPGRARAPARGPTVTATAALASEAAARRLETATAPTRAERRRRARRGASRWQPSWKLPVTVVCLGVLGIAVLLVLLQSAGVIDWSFLGPVA